MPTLSPRLSLRDYRALAEVRYRIRAFLTFSEDAARDAGAERVSRAIRARYPPAQMSPLL